MSSPSRFNSIVGVLLIGAISGASIHGGYLYAGSPDPSALLRAFRKGLNEVGYFEGQNVAIEFRSPSRSGQRR
jgi:hypothetical protein